VNMLSTYIAVLVFGGLIGLGINELRVRQQSRARRREEEKALRDQAIQTARILNGLKGPTDYPKNEG